MLWRELPDVYSSLPPFNKALHPGITSAALEGSILKASGKLTLSVSVLKSRQTQICMAMKHQGWSFQIIWFGQTTNNLLHRKKKKRKISGSTETERFFPYHNHGGPFNHFKQTKINFKMKNTIPTEKLRKKHFSLLYSLSTITLEQLLEYRWKLTATDRLHRILWLFFFKSWNKKQFISLKHQ